MSNTADTEVLKPRNTLQLFVWIWQEPELLKEYSYSVRGVRNRFNALWRPLLWVALLSCLIYLLMALIVVGFDLPLRFEDDFKAEITKNWTNSFVENLELYIESTLIIIFFMKNICSLLKKNKI